MKHILAILAVFTAFAFTAPTTANADCGSRVVSYLPCGRPVYATYQVYGYDRCGNPVGRWVTNYVQCGCDICHPRPVYVPHYDRDCDHDRSYSSHRSGGTYYGSSHGSCGSPFRSGGFYFSFGR